MTQVVKFIIAICLIIMAMPYTFSQQRSLTFNQDGEFKIVQFTDIHFKYNSEKSDSSLKLMEEIIEIEKPDLVVLTGDIITSKKTHEAWLKLANTLSSTKTHWTVTLGNHDVEYEMTGEEIMSLLTEQPYCLAENGPKEISGAGNYILTINSSKTKKISALLYFLDSQTSFKPKSELGTYNWVDFDQINWYREKSAEFTKQNNDSPYPALAFFHIPFPEYNEVIESPTTVGVYEEKVCSPDINSGLYLAMLESKDVMGTFVGHDHVNNYIGNLRGICLAYGQATGRESYGKIGKGARVIVLHENERKFDTWIVNLYNCDPEKNIWKKREYKKDLSVTYPDSFIKK